MPGHNAPYATWPQRAGALLIDVGLALPVLILGVIFVQFSTALGALLYLAWAATGLYFNYLNGAKGRSPGKAIVGLRTVDQTTGQHLGGGKGVGRYLIAGLIGGFTCGFGELLDYLFPLWDPKLQTLHDKVVNSVVLHTGDAEKFSSELFVLNAQNPHA